MTPNRTPAPPSAALDRQLREIVGEEWVYSGEPERYLYSRAAGGARVGACDHLVLPRTAPEIQHIVRLAARHGTPLVPMGGGLTLADLTVPVNGGIVLDMKRMDTVIEVDEDAASVRIEPGITVGMLAGYLRKHHPGLRVSVADAPPAATVCGNALISGSGHLSKYGFHSDMINGLAAVLHTGERVDIGACADSPNWFTRAPLPDLSGLFINWYGGTGIVVALSLKLYPRHPLRDLLIYRIEDPDVIPEAVRAVTDTGLMEDILIFAMKQKESRNAVALLQVFITGDDPEEMAFKTDLFARLFADAGRYGGRISHKSRDLFPEKFISDLMAEPKFGIEDSVDAQQGGGAAYIGSVISLENVPALFRKGMSIADHYGYSGPLYTIRNVGLGHSAVFAFIYPFNRADAASVDTMRKASAEARRAVFEHDGVPWKVGHNEQHHIYEKMDPGFAGIMGRVKSTLDPAGIFNPGYWDRNGKGGRP